MEVENKSIDTPIPIESTSEVSAQISENVVVEDGNVKEHSFGENIPDGIRMNTGSYRKRKAKKQIGAEVSVEDLRGQ